MFILELLNLSLMKKVFIGLFAIVLLASCSNQYEKKWGKSVGVYGEKFKVKSTTPYATLVGKMKSADNVEATVAGKVESVCQKKGCWMNLVSDNPNDPPMFVRFKDYGFFMPKDCSGKHVVMKGVAKKKVTSVDELKHYAMDAGKSEAEINAITKPKEELTFLASGVILFDK